MAIYRLLLSPITTAGVVPGDIIFVGPGPVCCDCVLVKGEVAVDESSLTGESMPVSKASIDRHGPKRYSETDHKGCTLYAGTYVLDNVIVGEDIIR